MAKLRFFPEQRLIHRIRANDRTVLGELFERYRTHVFGYICSHGGDQADAEDMLQEAIIALWQNVCNGGFELTSKLSTYLLAIAKNKWRAEQRKRSRIDGEVQDDVAGGETPSLEKMIDEEKTVALRAALDSLSPVCRQLLLLFYFEERRMADIARIMSFAGPDVVKAKKYQCKKALAAALQNISADAERRR